MRKGRIPDAWFAAQVDQADNVTGDIRHLVGPDRANPDLTFVANRPDWLADPEHWQEMPATLKINCPMRCTNGSRSVSLTAVPVY